MQDGSDPLGVISKSQLLVLTSPVPEASAWATMLAGVGMLGVVLRRRNGNRPATR